MEANGLMVIVAATVAVAPAVSVKLSVKLKVPAIVGVPERSDQSTVRPAGKVPSLTVQVPGLRSLVARTTP